MRALRFRLALISAGILAAPSMAPAQELPAGLQEGVFEVRARSIGSLTIPVLVLLDTGETLLLPLEPVLVHLGYEVEVQSGQRLWRPGRAAPPDRLLLDPPRYADAEGDEMPLASNEIAVYGGNVYLTTAVLARILDMEVELDWANLSIDLIRDDPAFPALARLQIEERRRRLSLEPEPPGLPAVPYEAHSGGLVLDWSLTTSSSFNRTAAAATVGAAVLGGGLIAGGFLETSPLHVGRYQLSYRRIFPDQNWINQLVVGQVLTQDLAPRSIVGAVVSNIPQQRDVQFSEIPVAPEVPEGWEFEVYQSGRLVGVSTAGTDEPVMVPVRYGQTPLEVRMVGPAGEEVVSQYRYLVPITHLPAGSTEYSAGVGRCPGDFCDGIGYGELRHGVGRTFTLGGGIQVVSNDGTYGFRPSALASYAPGRQWMFDLEARAEEFVRASVNRLGDEGGRFRLAGSLHQPSFGQPSFLFGPGVRWTIEGRAGPLPVYLDGRIDGLAGGGIERARFAVGQSIPRGYGEVGFETGAFGDSRLTGRASAALAGLTAFDQPISVSSSFSATRQGLRLLEMSSSIRPRTGSSVSSALRWSAGGAFQLSITFRQLLSAARINATAMARAVNPGLALTADGSIALGGDEGTYFSHRELKRRAGVVGYVFYDRNGDGTYDAADDPASGVSVLVGGVRVRTDSAGYYRAWNVTPYEITTVAVDTLSGIDPRYTVLTGGTFLRPVPHLPNRVDFPLAETRELLGRVVTAAGEGVGGVEIEIRPAEGGEPQTVRTFSDGTFYVSRLLPGEWRASVAEASLDALEVSADPAVIQFQVDPATSDLLLELEPFVLRDPDSSPPR